MLDILRTMTYTEKKNSVARVRERTVPTERQSKVPIVTYNSFVNTVIRCAYADSSALRPNVHFEDTQKCVVLFRQESVPRIH
jgi:hypothetical protein